MRGKTGKGLRAAFLIALPVLAACHESKVRTAELRTDRESVKLGAAKSVSVKLSMGAGDVKVRGGANDLMNGAFTYNVPEWKPKIVYAESGDRGNLSIEQPEGTYTSVGSAHYSWDLQLNSNAVTDLHVEMGAGNSNLELGELSLASVHVEVGAGTSVVDLTGNWKRDVDAHIEGGVGNATVRLPRNVGVRVIAEGGIGTISAPDFKKVNGAYVNDQFGKSTVTLNVKVEGGVGRIVLEMASPTV